ncbi:glycosyltransferase family 4 protein [Sphingobacterium lumbrici]|uniref:glycosyltransferase family 4 protein n=1 Tax=Sphingobacterium lumbrici TaxID=2559600 RepID=UPI00112A22C6|nr:glycosyltransferase family 4 protein [Sphingobacterium lumbrici]
MNRLKKWHLTLTSLFHYPNIIKEIKRIDSNILFIFPYLQTGGGERVHAEIMKTFSHLNPTCLITYYSSNEDMKDEFEKHANVINLERWGWKKSFRQIMVKKVAKIMNNKPNAIVFGCGNHFFYDIIPLLNENVKKIDLMHSYLGNIPNSFEQYSLPYAHLLDNRVVLGRKHFNQIAKFYKENSIDCSVSDQVKVIHNKVSPPQEVIFKDFISPLKVLFVARNSSEKRPELFIEITQECYKRSLPIEFIMIGDFECYQDEVRSNVTITGRITNSNLLNSYYATAHFVAITSALEGFPMVILEGLAYGAVPLSTDVGIVSDYINEKTETGFIIENSQNTDLIKDQFIEKLEYAIQHPKQLSAMSIKGQMLIREEFSEEKFESSYRSLLLSK